MIYKFFEILNFKSKQDTDIQNERGKMSSPDFTYVQWQRPPEPAKRDLSWDKQNHGKTRRTCQEDGFVHKNG